MEIPLISYISTYSIIPPLLTGLLTFKTLKLEYKAFIFLLTFGLFIEIAWDGIYNLWILNIWDFLEFTSLMFIFYKIEFLNRFKKLFSVTFLIVFLLRVSFLTLKYESIHDFTSNTTILTSLFLIVISMYSILILSKKTEVLIHKHFLFWFLLGIAIYFTGTIFITLVSLFVEPEALFDIYVIHSYTNIASNLIFTYSFYLQYKSFKSYQMSEENCFTKH